MPASHADRQCTCVVHARVGAAAGRPCGYVVERHTWLATLRVVAKNQHVKPTDRTRRTPRFRERALTDLGYEFDACVEDTRRLLRSLDDPTDRNAYLEAALLHARVLSEFLTRDETRPQYRDDMLRIDFASPWLANPSVADRRAGLVGGDQGVRASVLRLDRAVLLANKHLAHLTWARPSSARGATGADNVDTLFVQIVLDVATILSGWLAHALAEMPRSPKMDLYAVPNPPVVAEALLNTCNEVLAEFEAMPDAHQPSATGTRASPGSI